MRIRDGARNDLYYLLSDHLGSTALTVTDTGLPLGEMRYMPWGEARFSWASTPTDYRYTGQREEDLTGLYYYRARWYDPVVGRFAQADTIVPGAGNPMAWHRYAYALNNPLRYTDPTGHCAFVGLEPLACTVVVIGVVAVVYATEYVWIHYYADDFTDLVLDVMPSRSTSTGVTPGATTPLQVSAATGFPLDIPSSPPAVLQSIDTRRSTSLQREIRSLERKIAEHLDKLTNREGFGPVSGDASINQRAAERREQKIRHDIEEWRRQVRADQ